MRIKYYGHSCFSLTSKRGTTVLTDPYTRVGYELPGKLSVDIVTVSHQHFDHNYVGAVRYKKIVDDIGREVINDVEIVGEDSFHDPQYGKLRGKNIIFKIKIDGMTICHLGDLGEPCSKAILDKIGQVDILLIPIGGTYTIDAEQAKEYIKNVAPKVAIPMHYKPSDGSLDITAADAFLKLYRAEEVEKVGLGEIEINSIENTKPIIYMERIQ